MRAVRVTLGKQTVNMCREPRLCEVPSADFSQIALKPRFSLFAGAHHPSPNCRNACRAGQSIPHRWPLPLPSSKSLNVVWSCSSFCPTFSRTFHSAIVLMPSSVARTARIPVFLSTVSR